MSLWSKLRRFFTSEAQSFQQQRESLQELIRYHFRNQELLLLSLTHRSAARQNNSSSSNERLEFLGDAVLGLVIGDQLYRDYPGLQEGDLTKKKAMLVNESTLSQVAIECGLNKYILLSTEEEKAGGWERPSIVSDAFEAIIGAVYIDGGLEAARSLILSLIYSRRDSITSDASQRNYKGDLLELTQSRGGGLPRYDMLSETGPDHDKIFHVGVSIAGQYVGDGKGPSKKIAEQNAASAALQYLDRQENYSDK
ncbi:MAG: ribonuclease III [Candidatus Zixiibacteriota bacterium]|nr:MAG: ribonuclease III [candidate division Zixibacteria bacterium]